VQNKSTRSERFIFISEVKLILFKDNANRVKYKIKAREAGVYFQFRGEAYLIQRYEIPAFINYPTEK